MGKKTSVKYSPQTRLNWYLRFLTTDIDGSTYEQCNRFGVEHQTMNYPGYYARELAAAVREKPKWDNLPDGLKREILTKWHAGGRELLSGLLAKYRSVKEFNEGKRSISIEDVSTFEIEVSKQITMSFKIGTDDMVLKVEETSNPLDQNFLYNLMKAFQVLDGKRLDEVLRICPNCKLLFASLTAHKKEYCSRKCAMLANVKDKRSKNLDLERHKQNIRTRLSLFKKQGLKDETIRVRLKAYIKKKEYDPEEIPAYIAEFLGDKPRKDKRTRKHKEKGE